MRRLAPIDLAILAVCTPLWAVALGVHAHLAAEGRLAWIPLVVTPASEPDGVPVLRSFWPGDEAEQSELRPGDRLLSVGEADLAGAGRVEFLLRAYDQEMPAVVRFDRGGEAGEAVLPIRPAAAPWRTVPLALVLGAAAALALWRGRGSRAARAFALAAFAYAGVWSLLLGGGRLVSGAGLGLLLVTGALFQPLALRAIQRFPDGSPPPAGASRVLPWAFLAAGPLLASWLLGTPLPPGIGLQLLFALYGLFFASLLVLLVRRYRGADGFGRRQLRWVVYGFAVGLLPPLVVSLLGAVDPGFWRLYEASLASTLAIPICICIALLRHNLFDIDRLITATAAFSILSVLLLSGLLLLAPRLGEQLGAGVGIDPPTAQAAVSLLLAGLLVPAQRWIRRPVEQLFFGERVALQRGAEQLRAELAGLEGARAVFDALGARLAELLRLDSCVIYGDTGEALVPVFARGPAVPPAFARQGGLASLLEERAAPVDEAGWRRWARRRLEGAERGALEALGPAVLLPVLRGEDLVAFVCLGEKGSGDVYTATDLALLESVADRAALALARLDEAALRAEERGMNESLRAYVPAAVAQELARGAPLEPRVEELSVLFVDIRGYTAFAEGRVPAEIFAAINAYTYEASRILVRHGGALVEFHGDGLMAVFGAPAPLAERERRAVEAGLEIVDAVEDLRLGTAGGAGAGLSVGVGIATGDAYVGDIQAVDRRIWSVIGNTTNLAARLQTLSRDLDAALVLDETTGERAAAAERGFEHREAVRIRGRSEPMRVWLWPRRGSGAAAAEPE